MPSHELSASAKLILEDIYRRFHDNGEWPRYNAVLIDHPDLDPPVHRVIRDLEREYLSVHRPIHEASQCFVTVKALRVTQAAKEDIANLVVACRYLANRYLESQKPGAKPDLVDGQRMVEELELYPLAAQRVFALLKDVLPQVTDLSGRDAVDKKWPDFRVRAHAHHFRKVETEEQFFEAEQRARDSYDGDHAFSPRHEELIHRLSPLGPRKGSVAPSEQPTGMYFVSHAATDDKAASLIRDAILSAHGGNPDVFVSTRAGDIPGGKPWLEEIRRRLEESTYVMVLLTPVSVKRPWIWFESGAAWLRDDKVMIPVLAGGLLASEVPEPLRLLQLYSLEEPVQAEAAFDRLGLSLQSANVFASAIRNATAESRGTDWRSAGWDEIEVGGVRYIWGGSRDGLSSAPGGPAPNALLTALKEQGIDARFGLQQNLSNEEGMGMAQVFSVRNGDVLRPLLHQGQVLMAMRSDP